MFASEKVKSDKGPLEWFIPGLWTVQACAVASPPPPKPLHAFLPRGAILVLAQASGSTSREWNGTTCTGGLAWWDTSGVESRMEGGGGAKMLFLGLSN